MSDEPLRMHPFESAIVRTLEADNARLTSENERLRAALAQDKPRAAWADAIAKNGLLCEKNERLRAALEKICNGPRDLDLDYLDLFVEVKMEARTALSPLQESNDE